MKLNFLCIVLLLMLFSNCVKTTNSDNRKEDSINMYYFNEKSYKGIQFEKKYLGEIDLKSGEIVASDPFYLPEDFTSPFTIKVKPGKYKVYLTFVEIPDWGKRVAFARINFSEEEPEKWEVAKLKGDTLLDNEYPVDAGLGSFIDASYRKYFVDEMNNYYKINPKGNYYTDILEKDFNDDGSWAIHKIQHLEGQVFIFWSGLGDGSYKSYWGYKGDKIVCLVTDFKLFENE